MQSKSKTNEMLARASPHFPARLEPNWICVIIFSLYFNAKHFLMQAHTTLARVRHDTALPLGEKAEVSAMIYVSDAFLMTDGQDSFLKISICLLLLLIIPAQGSVSIAIYYFCTKVIVMQQHYRD